MKIQYMSDLHLEFLKGKFEVPNVGADVLVLAGDITVGSRHKDWFSAQADRQPVVWVAGNHEYYDGQPMSELQEVWHEWADDHENLHFLECEAVTIEGQHFVGTSHFSDFKIREPEISAEDAADSAERHINDFRLIDMGKWTSDRHLQVHTESLEWLRTSTTCQSVVVTHWPGHPVGINTDRYGGDILNSYFCSDNTRFIQDVRPCAWISGHTHHTWDIVVCKTHLVGNCKGYPRENTQFDPEKTMEIL